MNTSHMEEFDVIENYLRHGDCPIGIAKDQTCEEITASSTKASWKKTDTSLMLYDSSFNGRLSHSEFQVQIANIYRLAIKEKKIMVAALPVQQQTAVHLPVG